MKVLALVVALMFSAGVYAQAPEAACEAKAVSKEGKPLSGAAKNASMKKCMAEHKQGGCEEKAVDKNGKKLAGAAKNSFMKKCQAS